MITFKVVQNRHGKVYPVTKQNFEEYARPRENFTASNKYYAVCPFCDNPIMIHGLYEKNKVSDQPYGSHNQKNIKNFTYHKETMIYCPAYTGRRTHPEREVFKRMQPINKEIYKTLQENFSSAIYILKQDLGLYIGYQLAEDILDGYIKANGFMYYEASVYNLPWMLPYMSHKEIPLYGKLIREDSPFFEFLKRHKNVKLNPYKETGYYRIEKAKKFLNLRLDIAHHERSLVKDRLSEYVTAQILDIDFDQILREEDVIYGEKAVFEVNIPINEYRYPNLINSPNKKTDVKLQKIADNHLVSVYNN